MEKRDGAETIGCSGNFGADVGESSGRGQAGHSSRRAKGIEIWGVDNGCLYGLGADGGSFALGCKISGDWPLGLLGLASNFEERAKN